MVLVDMAVVLYISFYYYYYYYPTYAPMLAVVEEWIKYWEP